MDIRTKIFLGFAAMLILILSMCVMSIEYLVNIRHDSREAIRQTEIMGLSYEIETSLLEARRAEKNYLLSGRQFYIETFKENITKIREKTGRIKAVDMDADFLSHIADIEKLVLEYESGFLKDAAKYLRGGKNAGIAVEKSSFVEAARKLQEQVYPIVEKARKNQDRAIGWADVTISQAIMAIVLLGLAAIITGAIMTYYIPKQVTRSTGMLLDAMKKIEGGDLKARPDIKSGDEMEIMGQYFNRMLDALEETKKRVSSAEKLAAIGTLSAGVAHEINNPLTGILTSAHMVLKGLPKKHKSREDMEIIIRETIRVRDIVKGLLDFSRNSKAEMTPVDVNGAVEEALLLVKNQEAYSGINIVRHMQQGLPRVMADNNRLEQVFLNIIINAREAMDGDGELEISSLNHNDLVEIAFKDTGRGIPRENLDRVFEPFYTTKEAGKGTGLGLAVSYGIIKEYNGTIEIQSAENIGTAVTIRFNAIQEKGEKQS